MDKHIVTILADVLISLGTKLNDIYREPAIVDIIETNIVEDVFPVQEIEIVQAEEIPIPEEMPQVVVPERTAKEIHDEKVLEAIALLKSKGVKF